VFLAASLAAAPGFTKMSKPAVPLFSQKESKSQDKENIGSRKPSEGNDGFIIDKEQHPVLALAGRDMSHNWPRQYMRFRFPIVSRKIFGDLTLLKPGGLGVVYQVSLLMTFIHPHLQSSFTISII
jgi:hypothetical protein